VKLCTENLEALDGRVARPTYDRSQMSVGIVHFGVGGFHRSHQAMYLDRLMNRGLSLDWGICGVGVMPGDEAMRDALASQDGLYTLVSRPGLGHIEARVIGSIVRHLYAPDDPERVLHVLTDPRTRIVSLTVTEGGYNIDPVSGSFDIDNPAVRADLVPGEVPTTMFAYVVEALRRRRAAGTAPFTVMSCDNVQGNGRVARSATLAFATLRDPELAHWIAREVAFPSSMVDRITPTTAPEDIAEVKAELGIDDAWPVVCEPFTQWVLEDNFVDGRPAFEEAEVQLTSDVEPYERMKLRLLNASHQGLAYAGHLSGYVYAHEAASDPVFVEFLLGYMNAEARPTLGEVPGVDLDDYVRTLIARFSNPAIRDTIARLAAFSSDRIPKWVLPVIRANLASGGEITRAVAIVASWARYAEGLDEKGQPIDVQDLLRDEVMAYARRQREDPLALVRNRQLFGDLVDNARFASCYRECLGLFHTVGAHRTLENLNALLATSGSAS
jgi:mannitol 2-dehydrogenase